MQECDWTGTAAAVTALALTAGAWLWPAEEAPRTATPSVISNQQVAADQRDHDEDMARWRAEARRWDGIAGPVQLSSTGTAEMAAPVLR